ncbi:hypothetical protein [Fortiea contorta]|uniref:hypothetical protein n=1 Tax=Fortiea contorta TaxID=1892405 RepID=UPI000348DB7B|nr:hypothetical protein [Fortiea contorta]
MQSDVDGSRTLRIWHGNYQSVPHHPTSPSPHLPITPPPHHPTSPSPHLPIIPPPHHPTTPSPHHQKLHPTCGMEFFIPQSNSPIF